MHGKISAEMLRPKILPKWNRRLPFRPTVELLEDRCLLSVTSSVFVADPTASLLTVSGDISGVPLQQQGTGSLTSSYSGTIVADWDLDGLTINFDQPGTALNAAVTGNWQPKPDGTPGSAPADYGGKVTILFLTAQIALRDLVVAVSTANPLPLSGTGPYSFPSTETLTILWGTADYNAGLLGSGSEDLSSMTAQNASPDPGTFADLGNGSYRLTFPVSLPILETVENLPVTLHIDGQIVATAVLPVVNLNDGTTSNFNYATTAVVGGGPVAIEDPAAAVIYTPGGNLASMTVTLTNLPDDTAEFLGYDLGASGLTTNGYDPASGQLIITGSADASVYQQVLRTITYENDSLTPNTSDRQIQFVVSDGVNTSVVRTATVSFPAGAAPHGPARLIAPGMNLQSNALLTVSGFLDNRVLRTRTDPIMRGPSIGVKTIADDLATALITNRSNRMTRDVPFDQLWALEAGAVDLDHRARLGSELPG